MLPDAAAPNGVRPKAVPLTLTANTHRHQLDDLGNADQNWASATVSSEATSDAGGSYAVSEASATMFKSRVRRSPFSAALVLRIDGQQDSPLFSVGGGGVAAAMWKMRPQ